MTHKSIQERIETTNLKRRFNLKIAKREAKIEQSNRNLLNGLKNKETDPKQYHKALRQLSLRQTSENLKAFAIWLLKDLLLFIPIGISMNYYNLELQGLNYNMLYNAKKVTNAEIYNMQQLVQFFMVVTGALIVVCGTQICRNGLYHLKYHKAQLIKELYDQVAQADQQSPLAKQHAYNNRIKNKQSQRHNRK